MNEPWQQKSYRALVQFSDGHRELGLINLKGNEQGIVNEVEFNSIKLSPNQVEFVFTAYALGWENENSVELLKQNYTKTTDLRHIFRFPYLNKSSVFHGQLASSPEKLNTAFNGQAVNLEMIHQGNPINRADLEDSLDRSGYQLKDSFDNVQQAGDYFIEGNDIRIVFLPARYPVNTLVVDNEGHLAFVAIQGKSGQKGANYWTVGGWIKEHVKSQFGWEPTAVFALDNGMDPFLKKFDADDKEEVLLGGARENLNAAFSVVPDKAMEANNEKHYKEVLRRGGIDLTPANMNLQTQNDGGEIKFHIDPALLKQLQNAPGFVPVIISIQPMTNLRTFLEINT